MDVSQIPLPTETPNSNSMDTDFSTRAPSTFEAVLAQNQDLMRRLTVALRMNLDLEKQVGQLVERNRYLELQAQALHSENSQVNEINRNMEIEFLRIKEQRDSAEKLYAEFHTEATTHIEKLARRIHRLQDFQRRVRIWVRPYIRNQKSIMNNERKTLMETFKSNVEYREINSNLKRQITELQDKHTTQMNDHQQQIKLLVEGYESKNLHLQSENENTKQENKVLRNSFNDISERYQSLLERSGEFENRAVATERKHIELIEITDKKILELQEDLATNDAQLKSTLEELRINKKAKDLALETVSSLEQEVDSLRAQYQGLQTIWEKASIEAEENESKCNNLQKLNRDLSESLGQKRREIEFLQDQIKRTVSVHEEKLEKVYSFMKVFAKDQAKLKDLNFDDSPSIDERIEKLQTLLSEAERSAHGG